MSTLAEHYRNEAERARRMAETAPDSETKRRWLELEEQYRALALSVEKSALQ